MVATTAPLPEGSQPAKKPEVFYHRIPRNQITPTPPRGIFPAASEFRRSENDPAKDEGGMSCGQGSVILAHGLTPEEAMLRGNNADFWLVSFTADDLAEINAQLGLRLQFVLDTDDPNFKPDPANPTDPWHGNVFGLPPNGSNALEDVQIEFARRAVWRKPPHSELLGEWIPGALERVQRAKEQNKVNELKNMIGMTSLLGFPNADTTRAQFEAMLADAVSKLPRKVRCGSCKAEFRESFAKDLKVCPKCKASPFKSETIPTNA